MYNLTLPQYKFQILQFQKIIGELGVPLLFLKMMGYFFDQISFYICKTEKSRCMIRNVFICLLSLSLFISEITCQSRYQSLILSTGQFNLAVNPQNGDYIVLAKDSFYLFNLAVSGGWRPYKYKKNDLDSVLKQPIELNFIHDAKQVLFFAGGGEIGRAHV